MFEEVKAVGLLSWKESLRLKDIECNVVWASSAAWSVHCTYATLSADYCCLFFWHAHDDKQDAQGKKSKLPIISGFTHV